MPDFSKPYRAVPYFGIWAEDTADTFATRDVLAILAEAVEACQDDDVRERKDVVDALAYLDEHAGRNPAVKSFRWALDELHPVTRRYAARKAYLDLCRTVSSRIEVST